MIKAWSYISSVTLGRSSTFHQNYNFREMFEYYISHSTLKNRVKEFHFCTSKSTKYVKIPALEIHIAQYVWTIIQPVTYVHTKLWTKHPFPLHILVRNEEKYIPKENHLGKASIWESFMKEHAHIPPHPPLLPVRIAVNSLLLVTVSEWRESLRDWLCKSGCNVSCGTVLEDPWALAVGNF